MFPPEVPPTCDCAQMSVAVGPAPPPAIVRIVGPPAGKFVRETLNEAPDNAGALEETPTVKLPAMPLAVRAGAVASPFASVVVATVPPPANVPLAPDPPAE